MPVTLPSPPCPASAPNWPGEIEHARSELDAMLSDLAALDTTLRLFDPEIRLAAKQAQALLPGLNPIEQAFAKLKALLRKPAERTVDGLWTAIGQLLDLFPRAECANYLGNSG